MTILILIYSVQYHCISIILKVNCIWRSHKSEHVDSFTGMSD